MSAVEDYIVRNRLDYLTARALECLLEADRLVRLKAESCGCTDTLIRADLEARVRYLQSSAGEPRNPNPESRYLNP
jgi:hypothetical protein